MLSGGPNRKNLCANKIFASKNLVTEEEELEYWQFLSRSFDILCRTAGAYGPLVLAPAEGVGALQAPCHYFCLLFFVYFLLLLILLFWLFFYFFYYFYFFDFYLFIFYLFFTFFLLFFLLFLTFFFTFFKLYFYFFDFLPHILPHIFPQLLPQTTTSIANHPPTTFSVPKWNTDKCFERPAKILRGMQCSVPKRNTGKCLLTVGIFNASWNILFFYFRIASQGAGWMQRFGDNLGMEEDWQFLSRSFDMK